MMVPVFDVRVFVFVVAVVATTTSTTSSTTVSAFGPTTTTEAFAFKTSITTSRIGAINSYNRSSRRNTQRSTAGRTSAIAIATATTTTTATSTALHLQQSTSNVEQTATAATATTKAAWQSLTQKIMTDTAGTGTTATTGAVKSTELSTTTNAINDFDVNAALDKIWHYDLQLPQLSVQEQQLRPQLQLQQPEILKSATARVGELFNDMVHAASSNVPMMNLKDLDPSSMSIDTANLLSSPVALYTGIALLAIATTTTLLNWNDSPPPSSPYPQGRYDPITAREYFQKRPWLVLERSAFVFTKALSFLALLAYDKVTSSLDGNANKRAVQLAKLLSELGPAFIKIGQSLSIRSDILSPEYMRGLATLQDKVEPFDSQSAMKILEREWGVPLSEVLSIESLPSRPIAAASLGQVYKASLKRPIQIVRGTTTDQSDADMSEFDQSSSSNVDKSASSSRSASVGASETFTIQEVAIKVQRPDIQTQIALDMHLLREAAGPAKSLFNLNTDTVGLVDAWGKGFVDELDYRQEAENAMSFSEQIQMTPLKDVVLSPCPIDDLTTDKVLVTQWINGTRLDQSSSDDVTILCSICMNTYLTMLLEFGLLHCDPHPGNLLRTEDGKLAILDWGMVTEIPADLQLTLIEHMAHLTSGDYAEVPRDLFLLGFVPADKEQEIEDAGVVDVLADVYGQWTAGGGLRTINANEVFASLQDLAGQKGNLFQIPPYFAYIAKSFSVLEGIGLSNDPQYSIINQCLPYISNRLLTDKDAMGPALSTFIFGPNKGNVEERLVDYDRVEQLVRGFGSFASSATASDTAAHKKASGAASTQTANTNRLVASSSSLTAAAAAATNDEDAKARTFEKVADQVLDLVLAEEQTPLQEIIIEQLAKIVAASGRSFWSDARMRSGVLPSGRTVLGTVVDPFGLFRSSSLVNTNAMDEKTLKLTSQLIELMRSELTAGGGNSADDGDTVVSSMDRSLGASSSSASSSSSSSSSSPSPLPVQISRQDLTTFTLMLSRKLWDRRDAVLRSNNLFWKKMLSLTASRLESSSRSGSSNAGR